ncbi:MAG TPA: ethanolamine ammonia-lyase reactivating factor EutA, partial [Chroococcales cyanobacterium]
MTIKSLLSAGIDIGTTSTHLTLSRLKLANSARINQPGRLIIESSEMIHQSPIHYTPLKNNGSQIDAAGVLEILRREYARCGIAKDEIDTGAVIITGETSRLRNAREVVESIAELAGKFVVASAGPNLEAALSARGSGAATASKLGAQAICNIDIGGGTSNIAVFRNGELVETFALSIGGRMLRLNEAGQITSVTESGDRLRALAGQSASGNDERKQPALCARKAAEILLGAVLDREFAKEFLISGAAGDHQAIDEYWFSGGVAEAMLVGGTASLKEAEYGDMGVLLADELLKQLRARAIKYHIPPQPIRATVIGAGVHSLQLSGSTV